jgi:hypothetical protein
MRRTIRGVVEGEKPRKLKFRKGDFWQGLADDYNSMLSKLGALDETGETAEDAQLVEST